MVKNVGPLLYQMWFLSLLGKLLFSKIPAASLLHEDTLSKTT